MVEVYRPEQRSTLSKFMGLFQQGASLMKSGAEGWEAGKGMWDKFTGGGATGGGGGLGAGEAAAGGAAGKYGLGLKFGNVTAEGGAAAAPETAAAGTSFGDVMGGSIVGPAAAVAGGFYAQNRLGEAMERKRDVANDAAKERMRSNPALRGTTFSNSPVDTGSVDLGPNPNGLALADNPDRMSAIERRYSSQQTAQKDIEEAQKALDTAGLPTEERRSIAQKLERARQQLTGGGRKRG